MSDADQQEPNNDRQPIWSVPSKKATLFFTMFTILNLIGIGYFAWYEIFVNDQDSFHDTVVNIIANYVAVFICSAGVSFTTTEVVVVIGSYLEEYVFKPRRKRMIAAAKAEARAEERAAIRASVQRWSRRRSDAEARGEPFNEPHPLEDGGEFSDDSDLEDETR